MGIEGIGMPRDGAAQEARRSISVLTGLNLRENDRPDLLIEEEAFGGRTIARGRGLVDQAGRAEIVAIVAVLQLVEQIPASNGLQLYIMHLSCAATPGIEQRYRCARRDAVHPALVGVERVAATSIRVGGVELVLHTLLTLVGTGRAVVNVGVVAAIAADHRILIGEGCQLIEDADGIGERNSTIGKRLAHTRAAATAVIATAVHQQRLVAGPGGPCSRRREARTAVNP